MSSEFIACAEKMKDMIFTAAIGYEKEFPKSMVDVNNGIIIIYDNTTDYQLSISVQVNGQGQKQNNK